MSIGRCCHCDRQIDTDFHLQTIGDEAVCDTCAEELCEMCPRCDEVFIPGDYLEKCKGNVSCPMYVESEAMADAMTKYLNASKGGP